MSASDALGKQFHGTDAEFAPGDHILPRAVTGARTNAFAVRDTSQSVHTPAHLPEAARYGKHVYVVEPYGVKGQDPEYGSEGAAHRLHPQAQRTFESEGARVVRKVSEQAVLRAEQFSPLPRFAGQPEPRRRAMKHGFIKDWDRERAIEKARSRRNARTRGEA